MARIQSIEKQNPYEYADNDCKIVDWVEEFGEVLSMTDDSLMEVKQAIKKLLWPIIKKNEYSDTIADLQKLVNDIANITNETDMCRCNDCD